MRMQKIKVVDNRKSTKSHTIKKVDIGIKVGEEVKLKNPPNNFKTTLVYYNGHSLVRLKVHDPKNPNRFLFISIEEIIY